MSSSREEENLTIEVEFSPANEYRLDVEGELILEAKRTAAGFRFTLEAWEIESSVLAYRQEGNLFELANEWGTNSSWSLPANPASLLLGAGSLLP